MLASLQPKLRDVLLLLVLLLVGCGQPPAQSPPMGAPDGGAPDGPGTGIHTGINTGHAPDGRTNQVGTDPQTATPRQPGLAPLGSLDELTEVQLLYATDRARESYDFAYFYGPFAPALILALLLLATYLSKQLFGPGRFGRSIFGLRLVLGLLLVGLAYYGLQQNAQHRQHAEHLLINYGNERAPGRSPFELGTCTVSLPPGHEKGVVEEPSLLKLELRFDPQKHFYLVDIEPLEDEAWYRTLDERLDAAQSRSLFVFVHGFNNTFQDAAFRTAQIYEDLGFPGVPLFFSWPSAGGVASYPVDENNVNDAIGDLETFLDDLLVHGSAERIHLVAHSMGSRALSRAVKTLSLKYQGQQIFDELILAAPDIDAGEFEKLSTYLEAATSRVTLYASSNDAALTVSREFHGGDYPRAGESIPTPLTTLGVDSIDVSRVTVGHSYISDSGKILDDLGAILRERRPLDETIAEKVERADDDGGGVYWVLEKGKAAVLSEVPE
ncbi:MAG: alpha/beta fold hydrolase [Planctomycetota bacterium]|nr:alpha/beta fold hydrolase [Planctomycetota bacterium]